MARPALWALVIILPLMLGLRSVEHGEQKINTERLTADAASVLARDGWSVWPLKHPLLGTLIKAARGKCRVLVHFIPPEGVSDDKFRWIARPIGPVTYQYRGQISREFPRLVPMLHGHGQRYVSSFGLAIPIAPLIATARTLSCGRQIPDFTELRQHIKIA